MRSHQYLSIFGAKRMENRPDSLIPVRVLTSSKTVAGRLTNPADSGRVSSLFALIVLAVLIGVGVFFRINRWSGGQTFWCDEAFLLLNMRAFDLSRLLTGPLNAVESTQAGPPIFLATIKLLFDRVGLNEPMMRLPAMVMSILTLPLAAWVGWRALGRIGAIGLVALFAFSDRLIFHANVTKQYSWDCLIALGMIGLCLLAARRPAAQGGRWILVIGVVGAVLMWASHPLVFLLAPISLGMLYQFRRESGFIRRWTLANAMLAASFSLLYFVNISVQRDPFLNAFWVDNGGFPQSYLPVPLFLWLTDVCVDVLSYPVRPFSFGLLPPMIIGVIAIWRRQEWAIMGALVAPLVLMLLAGLTRVYPFQGTRLIIFLFPVMFLLSIYGAEALRIEWRRGLFRWCGWIPLVATAVAGLIFSIEHIRNPRFEEQLWPALQQLGQEQPAIPVVTQEPTDNAIVTLYRPNWVTVSAWPSRGRPLPDLPHYFLITSSRPVDKNGKLDYQIYYKHPMDRPGYRTRYDWSIFTEAGIVIGYEKLPIDKPIQIPSPTVSQTSSPIQSESLRIDPP